MIARNEPRPDEPHSVRPPAVAGAFYPRDPDALAAAVRGFLSAGAPAARGRAPKAIVAPHAGYVYSGPVAGVAYARLAAARGTIRRVVVMGPAHRAWVSGVCAPRAAAFATPLGELPVDRRALDLARNACPALTLDDGPHRREHCIEVQLPFLREALGPCAIVPLLTGDVRDEDAAEILLALWGGEETAIVVSSDLSHFLPYDEARALDLAAAAAIEALDFGALHDEQACGHTAVRALLRAARARGLTAERLDLRSSGDTAGPRDEVVGYGAFAFA